VDFKNTIIIIDVNIGSPLLIENASEKGEIDEDVRKKVRPRCVPTSGLSSSNRVTTSFAFKPLTLAEIKRIVDLQSNCCVQVSLTGRSSLELTEAAKKYVARRRLRSHFTARVRSSVFCNDRWRQRFQRKILAGEITTAAK